MSPRGRCDIHDVALGPTGECILCRRSAAPPPEHAHPRREPPGFAMLMIPVAILVVLLASAGALFVRFATWRPPPPIATPEARPAPHERPRLAPTEPDRDTLAAARRRVSITMYGTSWCGYCSRARTWMRQEGISFVEHDVERDPRAQARMRELNPRGGVPTFDVDGVVIVGFSQGHLESTIDRAAQRHL